MPSRRSSSPLYRASVPQASNSLNLSESSDAVDAGNEPLDVNVAQVDGNIRTVHFLLGCAVLLPWNGMFGNC
jgi:hypothetical protein